MIIKFRGNLYNCDGWKHIYMEDDYLTIKYFKTYTDGEDTQTFETSIDLIGEDYYIGLSYRHDNWDHKDIRQVRYSAQDIVLDLFMKAFLSGKDLIDLDEVIDQEKICKEAEEAYMKELGEDDI